MGDNLLLMLACRDGQPIAGALNFVGPEILYGRYWGCTEEVPFLSEQDKDWVMGRVIMRRLGRT